MKTMNASEFKAKCLAVLDEVAATGEDVTILKHGRPVARLVSPTPALVGFPQESLAGSIDFMGDVVSPAVDAGDWEAADPEGKAL